MKKFTNKAIVSFVLTILVGLILFGTSNAQDTKFRDQAWRYGLNLGLNYNSASLGWQYLYQDAKSQTRTLADFEKPKDKTKDNSNGIGFGPYGGLFIEYLSTSWWGIQFRASWDSRDALVKDIYPMQQSHPTANTEFTTRMSYLSFEPAIRIDQHLVPGLSLTAGPLVAVNIHGTFDYKRDTVGAVKETNLKVPDRPVASLGITGGLAYDFELSHGNNTSMYLSPFADYSWIAAQRKSVVTSSQNSSNDIWSTQTFRVGVRLSWENRNPPEERVTEVTVYVPQKVTEAPQGKKVFLVMPASNTIVTKNINGYFPILPYVFFEKGNQEIPSRYIQLSNTDAQNFNETDLGNFMKGDMTVKETNVNQLMITYYNNMNIFGDRMRKNPNEKLVLRGCDPDRINGQIYANKVKSYLVDNFGIDAGRITIIVEDPKKPSGSIYTDPAFNNQIDQENRRVAFVFTNPEMMKPVPYTIRDDSSIDNDMIFTIGDKVPFKSWDITITGEGKTMHFGPFVNNTERVNPAELMRFLETGTYNAKVVITEQYGKQSEENVNFTLYKAKETKNASRYLMLFDYDKSDAIITYESKIRKEITPGMKVGNKVIIHGHTDIIGNEAGNQKLSQERADQAKRIIDDQLGKENKKVDVQAVGIGQSIVQYTFDNKLPEGRMYDRNVFVEIIQ
jgi:outer membrane protein OmpA-like peptidoglycan-associated protein